MLTSMALQAWTLDGSRNKPAEYLEKENIINSRNLVHDGETGDMHPDGLDLFNRSTSTSP